MVPRTFFAIANYFEKNIVEKVRGRVGRRRDIDLQGFFVNRDAINRGRART